VAEKNDAQITIRVPSSLVKEADAIAEAMSQDGIIITQSDVLRAAMWRGLPELRRPRKR
jgi:predicted transcriptional regulator